MLNSFYKFYILLVLISCFLICIASTSKYGHEQEEWVDPLDMLTFDPIRKINRKDDGKVTSMPELGKNSEREEIEDEGNNLSSKSCPKCPQCNGTNKIADKTDPETVTEQAAKNVNNQHIFLQRLVTHFLLRVSTIGRPPDNEYFDIKLQSTADNWALLQAFSTNSNSVHPHDVIRILENAVYEISPGQEDHRYASAMRSKFEDYFKISLDDAIKIAVLLLLFTGSLCLEVFSHISWTSQLKRVFIIAFVFSFPWTYIHEYQVAVAEYKSSLNTMPDHCINTNLDESYVESLKSTLRFWFSTTEDPCISYHKKMLIDPMLTIPPTKILAVTLSRFFLEPTSHLGHAFSEMFKNFFSELPVQLWIPAFLFLCFIMLAFILLLTVCFGYTWSLNLPFWSGFQLTPSMQQTENNVSRLTNVDPLALTDSTRTSNLTPPMIQLGTASDPTNIRAESCQAEPLPGAHTQVHSRVEASVENISHNLSTSRSQNSNPPYPVFAAITENEGPFQPLPGHISNYDSSTLRRRNTTPVVLQHAASPGHGVMPTQTIIQPPGLGSEEVDRFPIPSENDTPSEDFMPTIQRECHDQHGHSRFSSSRRYQERGDAPPSPIDSPPPYRELDDNCPDANSNHHDNQSRQIMPQPDRNGQYSDRDENQTVPKSNDGESSCLSSKGVL